MGEIFVSYSDKDQEYGKNLVNELQTEGYDVLWNSDPSSSQTYQGGITEQLQRAKAVIVLWTPNSLQSSKVLSEANIAFGNGKLISILSNDLSISDLPVLSGTAPHKIDDRMMIRKALHSLGVPPSDKAWLPIDITKFERLIKHDVAGNVAMDIDYAEGKFTRDKGWHFEIYFDDTPNDDTFPGTRMAEFYIKFEEAIHWSWCFGDNNKIPGWHYGWLLFNDLIKGIAEIDQLTMNDDKPYVNKGYYNEVWEIMKKAADEFQSAKIPTHEIPPAIADYLIMTVLAMGDSNNISEEAALAIIKRMENMLDDWRHGRPPFQEHNGLFKLN